MGTWALTAEALGREWFIKSSDSCLLYLFGSAIPSPIIC